MRHTSAGHPICPVDDNTTWLLKQRHDCVEQPTFALCQWSTKIGHLDRNRGRGSRPSPSTKLHTTLQPHYSISSTSMISSMSNPGNVANGLPTELLCNIFRLAIDKATPRRDRCRLSLVCRQWWECVEGSVLLWTDISALDGQTYVRRALEKSQGAMIDLRYSNESWLDMDLEEFLAEASPHVARWQSLTAVVQSSSHSLESASGLLTTAQPPHLESLGLTQQGPIHSPSPVTLFGGAPAPSTLKHIMLCKFQVAIEPLRLAGLVSLHLAQVATISTSQLFEILRGSPLLETLSLYDNWRLKAIGSQPSTIQPIELTKLVSLSLTWLDPTGTHCILSNIRIPHPLCLSISSDIRRTSVRSALFTSAVTHVLLPTAGIPSSTIRVEVENLLCIIQLRDIELRLRVNGEDQIQEILGWLADGLGSEAAECPVHLKVDVSAFDPVRLAEVPNPLVVKHLSFSASYNPSLMEALRTEGVQPPDFKSSDWLLPQLESLSVAFEIGDSQRNFLSMLRSRYGGATFRGETESGYPMTLRSIELRGQPRTEGLVEEIKGLLGAADVFWAN